MSERHSVHRQNTRWRIVDGETVVINKKVQEEWKAKGIADVRGHFEGKKIRVQGPLTIYQDRPQIIVAEAARIRVIDE
jgi:DNA/RNA endonuclease YhcR with UshA esterase domain